MIDDGEVRLPALRADERGAWTLGAAAAPVDVLTGPFDLDGYQRRARGEEPLVARDYIACRAVRTIVLSPDADAGALLAAERSLFFVVSGSVSLGGATVGRGGLFLVEGAAGPPIAHAGECRLVEIQLAERLREAAAGGPPPGALAGGAANLKKMVSGDDGRSYFERFDDFFPAAADTWSPPRAVAEEGGLYFPRFPDGQFVGFHPEVVYVLVLVLSGEFVLEVSGDRAVERFGPGGVCFATDRTGEGHTDFARGITTLATVVLRDA